MYNSGKTSMVHSRTTHLIITIRTGKKGHYYISKLIYFISFRVLSSIFNLCCLWLYCWLIDIVSRSIGQCAKENSIICLVWLATHMSLLGSKQTGAANSFRPCIIGVYVENCQQFAFQGTISIKYHVHILKRMDNETDSDEYVLDRLMFYVWMKHSVILVLSK